MASDMILYDLLGTFSLSIYSFAMYYNDSVRRMYRDKHGGDDSTVQINDVFFSIHAVVITIFTFGQMYWYDGWKQLPSKTCMGIVALTLFCVVVFLIVVLATDTEDGPFTVLNWLYFLSFIKVGVTLIKYIPQAVLNYERKSTQGYNITQILLDLFGGLLSILQMLLDTNDMHEWNALVGNIQKLALGILTGFFDMVYIVQHYVLYPENRYEALSSSEGYF